MLPIPSTSKAQLPLAKANENPLSPKKVEMIVMAIIGTLVAFVFLPVSVAFALSAAGCMFLFNHTYQKNAGGSSTAAASVVDCFSARDRQKFLNMLDAICTIEREVITEQGYKSRYPDAPLQSVNFNFGLTTLLTYTFTPRNADEQNSLRGVCTNFNVDGAYRACLKPANQDGFQPLEIEVPRSYGDLARSEPEILTATKELAWFAYQNFRRSQK